ncbi:MAG: glycosyltransferase [Micrococcales bacterium]|nr:glycosyltransferase [Micrococcales bacterium]MCL2666486.1 glycosyltransferase [Micrococcales bacterium]
MTKTHPLRVVVVDHTAELGGAEVALLRLLRALDRENLDVRVLLFNDGPLADELRAAHVPVAILPLTKDVTGVDRVSAGRASLANLSRGLRLAPFMVSLVRLLRISRPDLVVTTSLKSDLIGGLAARVARRRLVWHLHDRIADDYLPSSLVRLMRVASRRLPRLVIANSQATASTVPVDCLVVPPPIDNDWVLDADVVAARPAPGEHPVVGLVGRISPTKGQVEFIHAAVLVAQKHPGTVFRVIGAPLFGAEDYAEQVRAEQQAAEDAGTLQPGQVEWIGFVSDPRTQIDALDVLVHASPVPEPFGQVVVEAMVRGVPLVATRAGGAVEIVTGDDGDEELGILVTPGDAPALAEAICAVLDDYPKAQARALAARTSAARRFDATDTAARVSQAWQRVVSRQTRAFRTDRTAG